MFLLDIRYYSIYVISEVLGWCLIFMIPVNSLQLSAALTSHGDMFSMIKKK